MTVISISVSRSEKNITRYTDCFQEALLRSARVDGERFFGKARYGKRRNTLCTRKGHAASVRRQSRQRLRNISSFSYRWIDENIRHPPQLIYAELPLSTAGNHIVPRGRKNYTPPCSILCGTGASCVFQTVKNLPSRKLRREEKWKRKPSGSAWRKSPKGFFDKLFIPAAYRGTAAPSEQGSQARLPCAACCPHSRLPRHTSSSSRRSRRPCRRAPRSFPWPHRA